MLIKLLFLTYLYAYHNCNHSVSTLAHRFCRIPYPGLVYSHLTGYRDHHVLNPDYQRRKPSKITTLLTGVPSTSKYQKTTPQYDYPALCYNSQM